MNKTSMPFLLCLMSSSVMASQTGKKQVTAVKGVPELILEETSYVPLHEGGLQGYALSLPSGFTNFYVVNDGCYQKVVDYINENFQNLRIYTNPVTKKNKYYRGPSQIMRRRTNGTSEEIPRK